MIWMMEMYKNITRQERREARQKSKQEKMPWHGRSIVTVYKNIVLKSKQVD